MCEVRGEVVGSVKFEQCMVKVQLDMDIAWKTTIKNLEMEELLAVVGVDD